MMNYRKDDIVLLAANRYHLGIVRANQASSTSDVLVQWMKTEPLWMKPYDIVAESFNRLVRPAYLETRKRPLYDIFELLPSEKPSYTPQQLWEG